MNLKTRISRLEQAAQPKENSEQQAYPGCRMALEMEGQ